MYGEALSVNNIGLVKAAFYADCTDHDIAVASKNIIAVTPATANVWRSETSRARFDSIPRTYIECVQDKAIPIAIQRQMQPDVPAHAPGSNGDCDAEKVAHPADATNL
jgi:hypothetical protein